MNESGRYDHSDTELLHHQEGVTQRLVAGRSGEQDGTVHACAMKMVESARVFMTSAC